MSIHSKDGLNNFIRGGDVLWHRVQMFVANSIRSAIVFVSIALVSSFLTLNVVSTQQQRDIIYYSHASGILKALFLGNAAKFDYVIHDADGHELIQKKLRASTVNELVSEAYQEKGKFVFWSSVATGLAISSALTILFFYLQLRFGRRLADDKFLRGAKIVDAEDLVKLVPNPSQFQIGGVPIPENVVARNILMTGSMGTGKSQALLYLMDAARKSGKKMLIYDKTGEFTEMFYRPGIDHLLNPLDARSAAWSPFADLHQTFDFDMMASFFVPDEKDSSGPHWTESARTLFSDIMRLVYEQSREKTVHEMYRLGALLKLSDLVPLLRKINATSAGQFSGEDDDREGKSIRSTLIRRIKFFPFMPKIEPGVKPFSVREWATAADDSCLFLTSRADMHEILKPFIGLWLELALMSCMTQRPDGLRILFFLDELASLPRMKALEIALTEARKFGVCSVIGLQNIAQLEDVYSKEKAQVLVANVQNKLILRVEDEATAKRYSDLLGKEEIDETSEGASFGADSDRDGSNISNKRAEKSVVMPSEITTLPDLTGFLKLAGAFPVARVKVEYKNRMKMNPDYVPRDGLDLPPPGELLDDLDESDIPDISEEGVDEANPQESLLDEFKEIDC